MGAEMDSFSWGPAFVTGIVDVDRQHRQLVEMINSFGAALTENTLSQESLFDIFHQLADYAQAHFAEEETMMVASDIDPRHLSLHLGQHNDFVAEISNLAATLDTTRPESCRPLFAYQVHWLAYHILGADQNMARQLQAIGQGMSPQQAFKREEQEANLSTEPLLEALNGLFTLVSQRNRALVELNQTLEAKVAERTGELLKANATLKSLSVTDQLTELPNRRYALNQLEVLWRESQHRRTPLSCLMIDADGFKTINDTYGHDAGDAVLQRLARELRHSVRSDDIVCRLGGDEFLAILPDTSQSGALQLAETIRSNVAALRVAAGGGYWPGSVSIGVVAVTTAMADITDLLKAADDAVYRAKRDGRNCVRQ